MTLNPKRVQLNKDFGLKVSVARGLDESVRKASPQTRAARAETPNARP